jgi:hypothetical protein
MISGGSLESFADVTGDASLYRIVVIANEGQTVSVWLREGTASDLAGNPSVASNVIETMGREYANPLIKGCSKRA